MDGHAYTGTHGKYIVFRSSALLFEIVWTRYNLRLTMLKHLFPSEYGGLTISWPDGLPLTDPPSQSPSTLSNCNQSNTSIVLFTGHGQDYWHLSIKSLWFPGFITFQSYLLSIWCFRLVCNFEIPASWQEQCHRV